MTKIIFKNIVYLSIAFSCFNCSDTSDSPNANSNNNNNPIDVPSESSIEFHKNYQTNDSIFVLNSAVQLIDSSYTIAGAVSYSGSNRKNVLMNFDKYGYRNWTKIMENTYTPIGIEKLFKNGNGYIGYRGHHYGSQPSSHTIYFNATGDVENEIYINHGMLGNDMIREGNNFIIAGSANGMALKKLNEDGELIWNKSYNYAESLSIAKLTDGNYISIGGAHSSSINIDALFKLNEEGEIIWSKGHRGIDVLELPNNEFLAITDTHGTGAAGYDGHLIRFDGQGNVIWSKLLENFRVEFEKPTPISIYNYNMNFFVCTYLNYNFDFIIKVFDQDGTEINSHIIENINVVDYTFASKTMDDGLLIGYTGGVYNFGIIKLSSDLLFN